MLDHPLRVKLHLVIRALDSLTPCLDVDIQPQNLELLLASSKWSYLDGSEFGIRIGPQHEAVSLYLQPLIFNTKPSPSVLFGI